MPRRRLLFEIKEEIKKIYPDYANAGDIVIHDTEADEKFIVSSKDYGKQKLWNDVKKYVPIGVVTVPSSHKRYDKSKRYCGIMSLQHLNGNVVGFGGQLDNFTDTKIYGGFRLTNNSSDVTDDNTKIYEYANYPTTDTLKIVSPTYIQPTDLDYGAIAIETENGDNPFDKMTSYITSKTNKIPSPYKSNAAELASYVSGALTYFDGRDICYNHQVNFNGAQLRQLWPDQYYPERFNKIGYAWDGKFRRGMAITPEPNFCPTGVMCAYNYITSGTHISDWYLPTLSEMLYVYARLLTINKALLLIKDKGFDVQIINDEKFVTCSIRRLNEQRDETYYISQNGVESRPCGAGISNPPIYHAVAFTRSDILGIDNHKQTEPEAIRSIEAEVGDVLLWDKAEDIEILVKKSKLTQQLYPSYRYQPLGIVVVPGSHNIYDERGTCGVMALKYASYETPSLGTVLTDKRILSNPYPHTKQDLLTSYSGIVTYDTINTNPSANISEFSGPRVGLCIEGETINQNPNDPITGWDGGIYSYVLSPYNEDIHNYEASVGVKLNNPKTNALSDFNGAGMTAYLCNITADVNWKHGVIKNSTVNMYPSACACRRYCGRITNQYLPDNESVLSENFYCPTVGEMSYLFSRILTIGETVKKIQLVYGYNGNIPLLTTDWSKVYTLGTSTLLKSGYSSDPFIGVVPMTGFCNNGMYDALYIPFKIVSIEQPRKQESVYISSSSAIPGDVVVKVGGSDEMKIVKKCDYIYESSKWNGNITPIGIVTIPASHKWYKTADICGIMSLNIMDYSAPTIGSSTYSQNKHIFYGLEGKKINADVVYAPDQPISPLFSDYILQGFDATNSPYIYPTLNKNTVYFDKTQPNPYPCKDVNGKGNTTILSSLHTQPNWQTSPTITNSNGIGYAPAACCCARYLNDFYLPSYGELIYFFAKLKTIYSSLITIRYSQLAKPCCIFDYIANFNLNEVKMLSSTIVQSDSKLTKCISIPLLNTRYLGTVNDRSYAYAIALACSQKSVKGSDIIESNLIKNVIPNKLVFESNNDALISKQVLVDKTGNGNISVSKLINFTATVNDNIITVSPKHTNATPNAIVETAQVSIEGGNSKELVIEQKGVTTPTTPHYLEVRIREVNRDANYRDFLKIQHNGQTSTVMSGSQPIETTDIIVGSDVYVTVTMLKDPDKFLPKGCEIEVSVEKINGGSSIHRGKVVVTSLNKEYQISVGALYVNNDEKCVLIIGHNNMV